MRDFRKLQIWNDGIEQVVSTYSVTKSFPQEEKFGLTSQMQRAAVSIPSNISEGLGYLSTEDLELALQPLNELQRKMNALISKIKSDL